MRRTRRLHVSGGIRGSTRVRAHARSGGRVARAVHLGGSPSCDAAVQELAGSCADQDERDHRSLVGAIAAARVTAEPEG